MREMSHAAHHTWEGGASQEGQAGEGPPSPQLPPAPVSGRAEGSETAVAGAALGTSAAQLAAEDSHLASCSRAASGPDSGGFEDPTLVAQEHALARLCFDFLVSAQLIQLPGEVGAEAGGSGYGVGAQVGEGRRPGSHFPVEQPHAADRADAELSQLALLEQQQGAALTPAAAGAAAAAAAATSSWHVDPLARLAAACGDGIIARCGVVAPDTQFCKCREGA